MDAAAGGKQARERTSSGSDTIRPTNGSLAMASIQGPIPCKNCQSTNTTVTYEHRCTDGTGVTTVVTDSANIKYDPATGKPVPISCPGCGAAKNMQPILLTCNSCWNRYSFIASATIM
jgi:hypothetical protein